jgi:hypothetical protein
MGRSSGEGNDPAPELGVALKTDGLKTPAPMTINVHRMRNSRSHARWIMMKNRSIAGLIALTMMIAIAGCGHKLIVTGEQHAVPLYPDEATYLKISQLQQQGG